MIVPADVDTGSPKWVPTMIRAQPMIVLTDVEAAYTQ